MQETLRKIFKIIFIPLGFVIAIMPYVPAFKEYVLGAEAQYFGAKEILISFLGLFMFLGGFYSRKTFTALQNLFTRTAKNTTLK